MRYVDLNDLREIGCDVRDAEIFPESWTKRHAFSLYEAVPRPCSALFLVCTDIRVTFFPQGSEPVVAARGDVVWIPMGVCYSVEVAGGNERQIDTYTLNFRLLDESGEALSFSDVITVLARRRDGASALSARRLSEAIHPIGSDTLPNRLRVKASVFDFLDMLATEHEETSAFYYPIRAGVEALQNEWDRNERMEKYAAMCGVSAAYFYRCFRAWSGQSPVEYRNAMRLSQAQSMLRNTDMRIGEIAGTVGFDDPFYFCRVFSARFGASPKEWRKRQRAEG